MLLLWHFVVSDINRALYRFYNIVTLILLPMVAFHHNYVTFYTAFVLDNKIRWKKEKANLTVSLDTVDKLHVGMLVFA